MPDAVLPYNPASGWLLSGQAAGGGLSATWQRHLAPAPNSSDADLRPSRTNIVWAIHATAPRCVNARCSLAENFQQHAAGDYGAAALNLHCVAEADCVDPACEDASHGHSHAGAVEHGHGHGEKKEACATEGCADEAHDHGHGHGGAKKAKVEKPRKKRHDLSGVSSVGISCEGELDFNALNGFMMRLLQTNARDLFRSKGVMCFHGQGDAKFVFQGVHEQIHFGPSQSMWAAGEKRINRMVFIGRKLDREALQSGFLACLHK